MIQILFCGRCLPAVRNVICLSLIAAFALCVPGISRAEDPVALVKWVAPTSQSQKVNPVAANSASIEAGRKIYMQRCAKCHGQTGHGDGPDAIELKDYCWQEGHAGFWQEIASERSVECDQLPVHAEQALV